jgi:hypothetical protein
MALGRWDQRQRGSRRGVRSLAATIALRSINPAQHMAREASILPKHRSITEKLNLGYPFNRSGA